jgi:hypothetical protein
MQSLMTYQIASALIPFFFSMGAGFFAGKVNPGVTRYIWEMTTRA